MSLPQGWCLASISDTGKYINGFAFKPQHWGDAGRPIIRIQNLTKTEREINRTDYVPGDEFVVQSGDILVSWSATLDAFIWDREEALVNQHIFRVLPENRLVTKKYLFYLLKEAIQEMQKSEHLHGSTMKHINRGPFMAHKVPIAPRAEQDRIVDEIEKQCTRLDDAVAALKRVQANLKRYRSSVLKAACEGRLVPTEAELARKERRSYEPASELLKRILAERRTKWESDQLQKMTDASKPPKDHEWKKKYKEPEAPEAADLPNLPEGWIWATLEQVSHLIRNGISTKPDQEKGLPILRISAVRPLSVDLDDVRFLTPSDEFREFKLCENDLLFTRYNGNREYVGVCGRVKRPPAGLVHPDKLIRVVPIRAALAPWVEIVSNIGFPRAFLNKRIRTTAGQSGVSGEDLKQLPIPLCPESEAIGIATEVDRALTTIQAIGRSFEANATRATQVRNSILHKAFSGKLVPQDPNDEPASVLLERIRAERAARATNNGNQKATSETGTTNGQRRRRIARLAHGVSRGKCVKK